MLLRQITRMDCIVSGKECKEPTTHNTLIFSALPSEDLGGPPSEEQESLSESSNTPLELAGILYSSRIAPQTQRSLAARAGWLTRRGKRKGQRAQRCWGSTQTGVLAVALLFLVQVLCLKARYFEGPLFPA